MRTGYVIPWARYGESAEDSLTRSWHMAWFLALGMPRG